MMMLWPAGHVFDERPAREDDDKQQPAQLAADICR
jgi:hypothetical protein